MKSSHSLCDLVPTSHLSSRFQLCQNRGSNFQSMQAQQCSNLQDFHYFLRCCAISYCILHMELQARLVEMRCCNIKCAVHQLFDLFAQVSCIPVPTLKFQLKIPLECSLKRTEKRKVDQTNLWLQNATSTPIAFRILHPRYSREVQISFKELRIKPQEIFPELMPIPSLLRKVLSKVNPLLIIRRLDGRRMVVINALLFHNFHENRDTDITGMDAQCARQLKNFSNFCNAGTCL